MNQFQDLWLRSVFQKPDASKMKKFAKGASFLFCDIQFFYDVG